MKRFRKIYLFAVLGALGGATAAALHQLLLLDLFAKALAPLDHRIFDVFLGLVIGAPIGFFPSYLQGRSRYAIGRAIGSGLVGALLGAIGGMIVVPISEVLHQQLQGGVLGRAAAVGLLGLTLGWADGISGGERWWRSLAGGLAGGVFAGALLELMLERQSTYADSAIVALILLGLSISLSIALFVNVLTEVWLEGLPGSKMAGHVYQLSRFQEPNQAILGSDQKGAVYIWIPDAQPYHAAISLTRKGARLRHLAKIDETLVNGHPVQEAMLQDGDTIQIGSARLLFRQRRKAVSAPEETGSVIPPGGKAPKKIVILKLVPLALALMLPRPSMAAPEDAAKVRITQVQTQPGNKVRVYVSVTDSAGRPLPDYRNYKLEIYESGQLVAGETISQGWSVSSVLVLDLSGSMAGDKFRQAKAAIHRYIDLAPGPYQIAVVGFSDTARLVSGFTNDKSDLKMRVDALSTGGDTALQDAIGYALGLFNSEGRHTVLVLTDGIENKSRLHPGAVGKQQLIREAEEKSITISTVGVGKDVDANYLREFEATGGSYLEAAEPDQVSALFEEAIGSIATEKVIEYVTRQSPDGLREKLETRLVLERPGAISETATDQVQVVRHGFIPDVKGWLPPYFGVLLVLLAIPAILPILGSMGPARRFRAAHLTLLRSSSPHAGSRDPNGVLLAEGHSVVNCPSCDRAYSVRSWRNNRCACMIEPHGRGNVCLHQALPEWLRHSLDVLTGHRVNTLGRAWLCRCAGDKEGY
jgi:Mg-chelatase subunit ChlD